MIFPEIYLVIIGLIWIIFATVQDIKTREVANWLNFSLIFFALSFRFFYSLFSSEWAFFIQGLIGLAIFTIIGNLFYYSRVFAGGDAKLLIALGTILPFSSSFLINLRVFVIFLFLFLFCGALYGLFYSLILMFSNFKKFRNEFNIVFKENRKISFLFLIIAIVLALFGLFNYLFVYFSIIIFLIPYLFYMARTVEEVFMIKKMNIKDLREGDWLYRDLKIKNKIIKAKWDGLSNENIKFIQKNYKKKVTIKEGIPFVPVFLISFIVLIFLWYSSWKFIFLF